MLSKQQSLTTYFQQNIQNNSQPILYEKVTSKNEASLMIFGNMGVGKSTLGSYLLFLWSKMKNLDYDKKSEKFISKKSYESVTKEVMCIIKSGLSIIDSPGGQDVDRKLSDFQINKMICDFIKANNMAQKGEGLSGLVFCFMVSKNSRLSRGEFVFFAQILNVFGLCCGKQNFKSCPRLNVVFTAASVQEGNGEDLGEEFDFGGGQEGKQGFNLEEFSLYFKNALVQEVAQMMTLNGGCLDQNEKKVQAMIDKLLPQDHFYAYKLQKNADKMQKESEQIKKLIQDNIQHGHYKIKSGCNLQNFLPVQNLCDVRNIQFDKLKKDFTNCVSKIQSDLARVQQKKIQDQDKQIQQILQQVKQIQSQFMSIGQDNPQYLMKISSQVVNQLSQMLIDLQNTVTDNVTKEIQIFDEKQLKEQQRIIEEQKRIQKEKELEQQKKLAEEKARLEKERKEKEAAAQKKIEAEKQRLEAEKQRIAKEQEAARQKQIEQQRKIQEEQQRQQQIKQQQIEQQNKIKAEQERLKAEQQRKQQLEQERIRQEELNRGRGRRRRRRHKGCIVF